MGQLMTMRVLISNIGNNAEYIAVVETVEQSLITRVKELGQGENVEVTLWAGKTLVVTEK